MEERLAQKARRSGELTKEDMERKQTEADLRRNGLLSNPTCGTPLPWPRPNSNPIPDPNPNPDPHPNPNPNPNPNPDPNPDQVTGCSLRVGGRRGTISYAPPRWR